MLGVAAGTMLPAVRQWHQGRAVASAPAEWSGKADAAIWSRAGQTGVRHPADVVRTIDGDTFEATVHPWPGLDMTTRVSTPRN